MKDVVDAQSSRRGATLVAGLTLCALIVAVLVGTLTADRGDDAERSESHRARLVTGESRPPVEGPGVRRTSPTTLDDAGLPKIYAVPSLKEFVENDDVEQIVLGTVRGQRVDERSAACSGCGVGREPLTVVVVDVEDAGRPRLRGTALEVTWLDGALSPIPGDRVALVVGRNAKAARRHALAALTLDVDATAEGGLYRWLGGAWNLAWGSEFTRAQVEALLGIPTESRTGATALQR